MQGNNVYEYAVVRIVPRVDREEFINVGVILYCRNFKFLDCLIHIDKDRLNAFCKSLDCAETEENLKSFKNICSGISSGSPISELDAASRFRWLTATRSTVIQTSKVHPGVCKDPQQKLESLFGELVL
jgi:hypothetical protein